LILLPLEMDHAGNSALILLFGYIQYDEATGLIYKRFLSGKIK